MKKRRLLTLALTLGLLLVGCKGDNPLPSVTLVPSVAPAPTAVQVLEFALPCYSEAGFHPIMGSNRTNLALGGLLYEGLFQLNAVFEAQGLLCTSNMVSENGLLWTFTLSDKATFSDGSPLMAGDVADTLNLARTSPLYAARLAGIAAVTAETGAVTVALRSPNGALPTLLDIPIIKGTGDRPLGTGPYILTGDGDTLALTAQTTWWQGKTLPRPSIPLRTIQAADDLIYAFDTRDISLVSTDLTGTNTLGFSGSYETIDYHTSDMLYVGFNTKKGVCADPAVRSALSRGFDRSAVAVSLLARHAQAAALPASPSSYLYDKTLADTLVYSPQTMSTLLEAAGWKATDGVPVKGRQTLSLTLLVSQDNTYRLGVADHLAEGLQSMGISMEIRKLPWDEYVSALEKGDFDLYLGEVRLTADFDPSPLLTAGGTLNYGGYTDAETNTLLAAFRAAHGEALRRPAAQALYANFAETAPFVVICFKNWSVLTQWGQLNGLAPTQQNVFNGFADWKIS